MITLITGLPGNGKTLYALSWVKQKAEKEGRPVFYARIEGLTLPWTLIDPYEWYKCPPNSIIVIDECQKSSDPTDPKSPALFGVRQRGAPVPIWASMLETHRHSGLDLVLITQDPMLIDGHDRKLCQQHFHAMRVFGMARSTIHEFTGGVRDNVHKSRSGSIRHEWRFNKEAYGWYKSAEVHTHKARIPMRVWLLLLLPFLIAGLCWWIYARWSAKIQGNEPPPPVGQPSKPVMASGAPGHSTKGQERPKTTAEYLASFVPRVSGLAYTAPAYDEVTKPVEAPYPAACVSMKGRCQCYTQQGTKLEVPSQMCRDIVGGGFFVAWNQPVRQGVHALQTNAVPETPAALPGAMSLGGNPRSHFTAQTNGGDRATVTETADQDAQPPRKRTKGTGA